MFRGAIAAQSSRLLKRLKRNPAQHGWRNAKPITQSLNNVCNSTCGGKRFKYQLYPSPGTPPSILNRAHRATLLHQRISRTRRH